MNEALTDIVEAALLAAGRPLTLDELESLFDGEETVSRNGLEEALTHLGSTYEGRVLELKKVASGYRLQVREGFSPWLSRLFEERPARYSRAFLETLAIIAYRQPVTRGEIEEIRGVAVNSSIIKAMQEREWIRVLGHKELPGRPALFGTTSHFLDHFGLTTLADLPPLQVFLDSLTVRTEVDLSVRADPAEASTQPIQATGTVEKDASEEKREAPPHD